MAITVPGNTMQAPATLDHLSSTASPAIVLTAEIARAARLFDEMRARSADPPGVSRASWGPGEQMAHDLARQWAEELDLECVVDFAGNLYMTLPGRDRNAASVMFGSHMDAVPHGGNYDGAAGVVAGLVATAWLRRSGIVPRVDVTVMAIRGEEMSWFPAPYLGSRMAFGRVEPEVVDTVVRFDTGRTLAEHMDDCGFDPQSVRSGRRHLDPASIAAYIEVHIEQGPQLVDIGRRCAVVTGIRGNHRYRHGRALGHYGHAGAVPRAQRHDALLAAVEWASAVEQQWRAFEAAGRDLVCTIGQFHTDAEHHTITKIPGEVRFTLDFRSYDEAVLADLHVTLTAEAERISQQRGVAVDMGPFTHAPSAVMDDALVALARRKAGELGIDAPDMASGAGHDCAMFASEGVRCAMIFIRNDHGSHNANEAMEIDDFAEACRLATGMLEELTR